MELHYWATLAFINLNGVMLSIVLMDVTLFLICTTMLIYTGYQFANKAGLL